MSDKGEIFILTGTPGAGKTTVAKELLQRYDFGFHIPIDDLREWVVSGIAHPLPEWVDETTRQFSLAFRATTQLATLYATAGFAVVIDQVIYPKDFNEHFEDQLQGHTVYKIFLQPKVDVSLARNASRTNKEFETSFLNDPIRMMHKSLGNMIKADEDWIIIDSSNLSLEETVDQILRHVRGMSPQADAKGK